MKTLNPIIRKSDRGFSRHSSLEPILTELGREFIPGDEYYVFDHLGWREKYYQELGIRKSSPMFVVVNSNSIYVNSVKTAFENVLPVYEFSMIPNQEIMDTFIMNEECRVLDLAHLKRVGSEKLIHQKVFTINNKCYDILEAQAFFMNIIDQKYSDFNDDPIWHRRWDAGRAIDIQIATGKDSPAPRMDGNGQGDCLRYVLGLLGRKINSARLKCIDIDLTLLNRYGKFQCMIELSRTTSNDVRKEHGNKAFYITSAVRDLLHIPAYRATYRVVINENEEEMYTRTLVDAGEGTKIEEFGSLQEFALRLNRVYPAE